MIECGISTTSKYYTKEFPWEDDLYNSDEDDTENVKEKEQITIDPNEPLDICPIDTLVLSVFRGD